MTDTITSPDSLRHQRIGASTGGVRVAVALAIARSSSGSSAVVQRRAIPIHFYVGPNGSGKTLCVVHDTMPTLDGIPWECDNPSHEHTKRGITSGLRLVYSTMPIYDERTGELHPLYRPFKSWHQFLFEIEHADCVMDEIAGVASSRDHAALHPDVILKLNTCRKFDIFVRVTAPAWARADKVLREVAQGVTECRGFVRDSAAVKNGGQAVLWAPNRLFRMQTYDMKNYDEWSAGKRAKARIEVKEWFWGPDSREFKSYGTLDAVERFEAYDPKACGHCGKPRRTEYCNGKHELVAFAA